MAQITVLAGEQLRNGRLITASINNYTTPSFTTAYLLQYTAKAKILTIPIRRKKYKDSSPDVNKIR